MADNTKAAAQGLNIQPGPATNSSQLEHEDCYFTTRGAPHALRDALRSVSYRDTATPSGSTSEEDYDDQSQRQVAVLVQRRKTKEQSSPAPAHGSALKTSTTSTGTTTPSDMSVDTDTIDNISDRKRTKVYTIAADDKEMRDILRRGMQRAKETPDSRLRRKGKFRDYVFTRKFSTFDTRGEIAATSPFHGFFTLFWIGVGLFMIKIGAENWKNTGSPLGTNDIMKNMFKRDFIVVLASDGVLCASTGVSWILQLLVFKGYLDWDGAGWIIQNIWQSFFVGANIGWTQLRDWPWTHTVFIVLHTLVMLMKQHSYAFYNGHLSTVYKRRAEMMKKLKLLENIEVADSPSSTEPSASSISPRYLPGRRSVGESRQRGKSLNSGGANFSKDLENIEAAIVSNQPLDLEQIQLFEHVIKWEIDVLTEDLMGKATSLDRAYPANLTWQNHYEYIVLPTLVYELEYPRTDSINWRYVGEKVAATFGVIFVMTMISQASIYPVVMKTFAMKEAGMSQVDRLKEFPWVFSDLIFPFMVEYLLTWYVIWEAILNVLGEVTCFADREFYNDWWNSVSWDQFARDWNRPVHNFLLRHVYHSSISAMKVKKHTATLITFFLSACVHELVMWCIFKKLRGYLLFLQMCQLPLVALSRTRWLRGKQTLGNVMFWVGIFTGPSVLCSLYLIL